MEIKRQTNGGTKEEMVTGSLEEVTRYVKQFMADWIGYVPKEHWLPETDGQARVVLTRWNTCD